jgi:hypothetical protein
MNPSTTHITQDEIDAQVALGVPRVWAEAGAILITYEEIDTQVALGVPLDLAKSGATWDTEKNKVDMSRYIAPYDFAKEKKEKDEAARRHLVIGWSIFAAIILVVATIIVASVRLFGGENVAIAAGFIVLGSVIGLAAGLKR